MRKPSIRFSTAVFKKYNYLGLVGGVIGFCLSFLPSLLPRPWLFQGLVTGVSLAIGYGCGCTLSWILRWLLEWEPPKRVKHIAWWAIAIVGPIVGSIYLYLADSWQSQVTQLIGVAPPSHRYMGRILLVSMFTGMLLLYASRVVRYCTRHIIRHIDKLLPRKVSIAAGILLVAYLLVTIFNGLLFSSFVRFANTSYAARNASTAEGVVRPTVTERSGGPESLIAWETLGYQGRNFVGRGPSQWQLANFAERAVQQPIRVYAGLDSAPSAAERAALAVRELDRTKAFEREVLVIANATGTGWLEPQSMDSIEYMYGGDTAIVSMQYSYLPSWLSFLVNKQDAKEAGQHLFDAVYGKWAALPEAERPRLITYGLSLGSYGGQAAFSGANDLKYTTDGALFIGTPSDTELWKTITKNRDAGSKQIDPVYKEGRAIRFVDEASDFEEDESGWHRPRTLYMQHPSDPVVWFDFDLIFNKPDWLRESRGADVSSSMQWYPFITFVQVTLDQLLANSAPTGHGHNYGDKIVSAWAAVATPDDWSNVDTQRLQSIINTYHAE